MNVAMLAQSPRLQALQVDLAAGNAKSLAEFWQGILNQGAPLIETIEGDDEHSLVTFLWRSSEISRISIVSLLTNPTTYPMTRMFDTDLWYLTLRLRNDIRTTYQFVPIGPGENTKTASSPWANWRPDPLNPARFAFYTDDEDPTGVRLERSILELAEAPSQPWLAGQDDVPSGAVSIHHLRSAVLDNERRVWVYTPHGYIEEQDRPYALLILFDGWGYLKLIPTTTVLDNLLRMGRIAPMIAVFVDSISIEARIRELIYHDPFNDFLTKELMPWIQTHFHVTSDPEKIILAGSSAGGLAAAYAGLRHLELFGNILTQSGAYRINPAGEDDYGWMARQFAESEKLPLRFHIDVGLLEENSLRNLEGGPSLLASTRHLHEILQSKGYEVHYTEFNGGHDYICWCGTLPEGLQSLLPHVHE